MRYVEGRPAVSVIVPTKNRETLIRETLESIRAQTFADWEAVIVDDGSTDGTEAIVAALEKDDPRVRWVPRTTEPGGVCASRNFGVDAARAPYVVFLDSDDLLTADCLEGRVCALDDNPDLDFAVFRSERFHKTPGDVGTPFAVDTLEGDLDRYLRWDVPWQTAGTVWRKSALERIGPWDINLKSATDLDYGIRAIASGCRYIRYPVRDCYWRSDPTVESITTHLFSNPEHLHALPPLFVKWRNLVQEKGLMTPNRQKLLIGLHYMTARNWLRAGRRRNALAAWSGARKNGFMSRTMEWQGLVVIGLWWCAPVRPIFNQWVKIRRLRG